MALAARVFYPTTSSGSGAPTDAQYWTAAADATLSAEKSLSGITGIVYSTAGTPSAAIAGTHYQAPLVAGTDYIAPTAGGWKKVTSGTFSVGSGTLALTLLAGDTYDYRFVYQITCDSAGGDVRARINSDASNGIDNTIRTAGAAVLTESEAYMAVGASGTGSEILIGWFEITGYSTTNRAFFGMVSHGRAATSQGELGVIRIGGYKAATNMTGLDIVWASGACVAGSTYAFYSRAK